MRHASAALGIDRRAGVTFGALGRLWGLFSEKFSGRVKRSLVLRESPWDCNRQVCRSLIIALLRLRFDGADVAAIARADDADDPLTALMMGGSGMPTPSEFWQDTIITDYIDPATGGNYTPVLVPTPESFASTSVPTGLADLQAAMGQQPADTPYLVEGYSQSAVDHDR